MEFSDSEEEVIDLNEEKDKLKDDKKMEKSKSKSSSSKNMKWVKSSLESISQMAKNEVEEIEYEENNIFNQEEENININNDNEGEDQEKLSDYDNYNDKENKNNYDDNYNKNNDFTEKTEETHADTNMSKNKQNFYTFIWDEGGENVKLIGSFSNWKQKYEMEKDEKDKIYKFSLPLNNEIYQYKFIVDGIWKCSKNQETIDDGKGNINNILDLTKIINKPKDEGKKKNTSKKGSKSGNKKKIKEKKKKEKKKSETNSNKENKENKDNKDNKKNKNKYGNIYPDPNKLTEPNHNDTIGKAFNINNLSKQKKIGNPHYYKFEVFNSYSSNKSYLNILTYRHTILNHIVFQKKLKKKINNKIGIISRYREKATTFIYYN